MIRVEHRLNVFENKFLRRVVGPKRDENWGRAEKASHEELLYKGFCNTYDQIESSQRDENGSRQHFHGFYRTHDRLQHFHISAGHKTIRALR